MPFKKGQSGNPGGRKKKTQSELDLIAACRKKSLEALNVIERLMHKADGDHVRLRAAMTILERGYGTAIPQSPATLPTDVEPKQVVLNVKDARVRADPE